MHVFYVTLPWVIDQHDYNCSSRSLAEWKRRGSVNEVQAAYFLISGILFVVLYIACLVGMARGQLLKNPCYRLMFFNGIVDILDLIVSSFFTSYFNYDGTVLCSSPALSWFAGHLTWSVWCGATFNCVVLAVNRVVEMIPAARCLRFLFRGKLLYMWMVLSVLYMVVRPFVTRPIPFNSMVTAYVSIPLISDDVQWELSYYPSLWLAIHNVSVITALFFLYTILCIYVLKTSRGAKLGLERTQIQLFLQALCICSTMAITAIFFFFLEFFSVPRDVVVASSVVWQFSHGIHSFTYMCFNKQIRLEVLQMFRLRKQPVTSTAFVSPYDFHSSALKY